ncbi:unnamed protein product [Arctogadus glacialis]
MRFQVNGGGVTAGQARARRRRLYNNENDGPAGGVPPAADKVRLRGVLKYRAQLDTKSSNVSNALSRGVCQVLPH